jgi:hypothetical protein
MLCTMPIDYFKISVMIKNRITQQMPAILLTMLTIKRNLGVKTIFFIAN